MIRTSRWPLAAACLGLGLAGGFLAHQRLIGQPPAANPPVPRELTTFGPVVKRVLPAVVSIEAKGKTARQPEDDSGFGSGVLIDPAGVVLTNNHVVHDADSVEVTLHHGRKFTSRDIRRDPKSDLAVVRLAAREPLPFLEFADSDAVEVGDRVLAVGAPFGLTGSVTHGIVSGKGRNNLRLNPYEDWLQTDAAVNPGNSGGPLVTLDGKVVGITAAIKTRSGGFSGVGLAVASNLCKTVSAQLLKDGVVRRGYLGAGVADLDAETANKNGLKPGGGAVVTRVFENSPAAKAGIAAGDVITTIAGQPVKDALAVQRIVSALPPGRPAEVAVVRNGKPMLAKAVIESQPEDYGLAPAGGPPKAQPEPPPALPPGPPPTIVPLQELGLAVSEVGPEIAVRLGYPANTRGVLVVAVTPDSPAASAGLKAGLIVVKVDRTAVTTPAAFQQALAAASRGKGAVLHVLRPNGEIEYGVLRLP